jgi:hypothetical protein
MNGGNMYYIEINKINKVYEYVDVILLGFFFYIIFFFFFSFFSYSISLHREEIMRNYFVKSEELAMEEKRLAGVRRKQQEKERKEFFTYSTI